MAVNMELFWSKLDKMGDMETLVLATSQNDIVTARPISALRYGDELLIRTDEENRKAVQIKANPNVAVCMGDFYLQGLARILGRCAQQGNPEVQKVRKIYEARWPEAFSDQDSFLSGSEVFIVIHPTHISQWVYEGENIEGLFHLKLEDGGTA